MKRSGGLVGGRRRDFVRPPAPTPFPSSSPLLHHHRPGSAVLPPTPSAGAGTSAQRADGMARAGAPCRVSNRADVLKM